LEWSGGALEPHVAEQQTRGENILTKNKINQLPKPFDFFYV